MVREHEGAVRWYYAGKGALLFACRLKFTGGTSFGIGLWFLGECDTAHTQNQKWTIHEHKWEEFS